MKNFMNSLNIDSENLRKVAFIIVAVIFVVVFLTNLMTNQKSEGASSGPSEEVDVAPSAVQPPPLTPNPQTIPTPTATQGEQASTLVINDGAPEKGSADSLYGAEVTDLTLYNNSDGLVTEPPKQEVVEILEKLAPAAASILENPKLAPYDKYNAFSSFLSPTVVIPGEGFFVANPAGLNAQFSLAKTIYTAPGVVEVEISASDRPGDNRFMTITHDGRTWLVEEYRDSGAESTSDFHTHD